MTNRPTQPQALTDIMEKGYKMPEKEFNPNLLYSYVPRKSNKYVELERKSVEESTTSQIINTRQHKVGFCFDGSFLPIRNGCAYNIYNLMRTLSETEEVDSNLILCDRGSDKPDLYHGQDFNTVFTQQRDYYSDTGVIEKMIADLNIDIIQLYSSEAVLNLAPRIKKAGKKIVFEIQNIDHILYERLGRSSTAIQASKLLQEKAIKLSDFVLCRSDVDRSLALELGASPDKVDTYRGGIKTKDIEFKARTDITGNMVLLGHMYYDPNINALTTIAEEILPSLPENFNLTVIGSAPEEVKNRYSSQRIIFKDGVDDISKELQNYEIGLAPLYEGSGTRLKILDYMASGLHVLSTNIGVEGLDNDISSVIHIEDNSKNYSKIINEISKNTPTHLLKTFQARKYVVSRYDWSNCLEPFFNAYSKL